MSKIDIFKILGSISVDDSQAKKALANIGSAAVKVGKTVATGLAVAGGAVAGLVTASVNAYADYEQLVGGVETLFKDSAGKIQEYAKNAYKTAGLSANEYMETVTSFSASLIQSLGGDTAKAAEYSQMAITDMSDNANKMGTDMSMIQNAYQGFAKQNYTMLDNLKLGYGGTQQEMYRLMQDAQKLDSTFDADFSLSSKGQLQADFADIVQAIHIIQNNMGITGTTAKEASATISGSIASMKSSWSNLLVAISADDLPFEDYVKSFADSVSTVADNIIPRVQIALNGVVMLINQLAPIIVNALPGLVSTLIPAVISAATGLINALVSAAPQILSALLGIAPQLLSAATEIIGFLISALPELISMLCSSLLTLLPMLVTAAVQLIVMLASNAMAIIQPIIDILPDLIVLLVNIIIQNLPILLIGIGRLVVGIIQAIPQILSGLWEAITSLASQATTKLFGKIEEWIRKLFPKSADTVLKILSTIKDAFSTLVKNIGAILSVVVSVISTPFKLAWNGVKLVWNNCVAFFRLIFNNIKAIFSVIDSVLAGDFRGAWNGVKKIWSNCVGFFKNIISNVKNAFSNVGEILAAPFRKGRDAVKKIVDNIKGFFTGLKLNFPKIKLPHFSIKPSGWKIGDLLQGSIPKLGIDWYAKAMNNPMVMNSPTIFGYDPETGRLKGGGESGSEVVAGTNTLMGMIGATVESKTGAMTAQIVAVLTAILEAIVNGNSEMLAALLEGHVITINEREVGRTVRSYAR